MPALRGSERIGADPNCYRETLKSEEIDGANEPTDRVEYAVMRLKLPFVLFSILRIDSILRAAVRRTSPGRGVASLRNYPTARSAACRAVSRVFRPAFSAAARASHFVRRSSNSLSVRCSMPTRELRAAPTLISSSSLTWMAALSRFCEFWIRKTMRNVTIVVPVLITSCHVSEKPNSGPLTAQSRTIPAARINVDARPAA